MVPLCGRWEGVQLDIIVQGTVKGGGRERLFSDFRTGALVVHLRPESPTAYFRQGA